MCHCGTQARAVPPIVFRDPLRKLQIGGWHAVSMELLPEQKAAEDRLSSGDNYL
jgi:hypothetical protein